MIEVSEESAQLPKGWTRAKLEDVIVRISNGTTRKQVKEKTGVVPVTRIETISNERVDLEKVGFIKESSSDIIERFRLSIGDILFSHINSDSHLGKTAIFNFETFTLLHGMNLLLIRPNKDVLIPQFLNYLFNNYRSSGVFVSIAQHAVNQSSINQTKLKKLTIPVAPLPEQRRIVTKVEVLFSFLDAGVESIRKVKRS